MDLEDDLRSGRLRPSRAASLAVHLPPGSMTWRETGGPLAWSDEIHMLAEVEHAARVLAWMKTEDGAKGRRAPKRIEPPAPAHERRAEEDVIARRAARWQARRQATE